MATFNERERGEEAKFASDLDTAFRIVARRNRLLGEWAADNIGLTDSAKTWYVREVVQADFEEPGDDDIVRKVLADFAEAGLDIDEVTVREALAARSVEARRAVLCQE